MVKETQRTGKEGELRVIGELLRRGFDIYLPLIDIGGIDCIIKTGVGYKEIQIKTREKLATKLLFDAKEFTPRDNFFIICYYINEPETFWVIPSKVFKENAYPLKKYGRLRLILGDEDSKMRRKLHHYRNNFFQLKEGTIESAKELQKVVKVSGWQKLKEMYPSVKAVEQKIKEAKEKDYSKGYIKVLENLRRYWKKRQKRF
jgi:hypothetical protein